MSAILWHCFLSNRLLKDHNSSKLTRLSDWKMIVEYAELEVLSKSVSWIEALKMRIVTLSLALFLRDRDIVDIARRKFTVL